MMANAEAEPKKLLVVDDEAAILKLLKALLTRAKYRVAGCESGAEALKLLSQGEYDLMITDAIMPNMSGFDLVKAIRGNPSFGEMPILMLTRKNERADVQKALAAGVTDYVLKPIDEHLLIDKVEVSLRNLDSGHRLRDVAIHGEKSEGSAGFPVRIISVRETGILIRFPFQPSEDIPFQLITPILGEIGIKAPIMKMISCKDEPAAEPFKEFPYVAEFSFVGMSENELKKIRTWLQKQEIQRKK